MSKKISSLRMEMFSNNSLITTDFTDASNCTTFIVTVPTSVNKDYEPDLTYLELATSQI